HDEVEVLLAEVVGEGQQRALAVLRPVEPLHHVRGVRLGAAHCGFERHPAGWGGAWRVTSPLPSSRDRTVSTVVCAGAGSSNVAWMVRALIGVPVLDRACITSASSAPAERDLTPGIPSPSARAAAGPPAPQRRRAGR